MRFREQDGTVNGVHLREATLDDVPAVLMLERATAEAPHWDAAVYETLLRAKDGSEAEPRRRGPKGRLIVALRSQAGSAGEPLVGFVAGRVVTPEMAHEADPGAETGAWGELEMIVVAPEMRRRGLGRAMCVAMLGWMRSAGAARAELEVRASSVGAVALYRSLGFVEQGRRRGYYSIPSDDAVLMATRLTGAEAV